ncbi:MAG: hypothetical protein GVY16_06250 [Planctomycetes bacterium]|nr:hypothetical protein [Planctomycetota bacterium]
MKTLPLFEKGPDVSAMCLGTMNLGTTVEESESFRLLDRYVEAGGQVKLVVAIGKPRETILVEDIGPDGSTTYDRDADGNHHACKRPLDELIVPIG